MQFSWVFSGDGLLALAAGVITFVAVMIQIHYSSRELREQMKAQNDAQMAEYERRKRAVARAMLFEIDSFYRHYFFGWADHESVDSESVPVQGLPVFRSTEAKPFLVYRGNISEIGGLESDDVRLVVGFYGAAGSLLMSFTDYREAHTSALSTYGINVVLETQRKASEKLARLHLKNIYLAAPRIVRLTYLVCHRLCQIAQVEFEPRQICVAAKLLSLGQLEQEFVTPSAST